jgi:ketosteroid isomerase-like protein
MEVFMSRFHALLVLVLGCICTNVHGQVGASATATKTAAEAERTLHEKDQVLLDAFAPGDRKVWEAALAPNAVYVDENGEVMQRDRFLKQLTPLPAGSSGHIKIDSYRLTLDGDIAIVIHTDAEEENYHGQLLNARYLTTETWKQNDGDWKLLCVHAYAVLRDPPEVSLSAGDLDGYAGRYTAGDLVYVIRREDDHLVGGREGKQAVRLSAEVRDVLFVKGQPRSRKVFERGPSGRVIGFRDRREGVDVVWKRVGGSAE